MMRTAQHRTEQDMRGLIRLVKHEQRTGSETKFVVLLVGQGLRRRDDDRLTGVNAHGICTHCSFISARQGISTLTEVFHVANGDAIIERIPYNLIFDFLVSLD